MIQILNLVTSYGFPLVLSIYLIIRIDKLLSEVISNQKSFQNSIITEIKDIKTDIYELRIDMAKNIHTPGL